MPLCLSELLQRFVERRPVPVMIRSVLERCVQAERLDAWFDQVSEGQYTRHLLFSTVFDLVTQVVFRQQRSVHAAYQNGIEQIGVSVSSIYNKLNGLEPSISAGLVRESAAQGGALIDQLGAPVAPLLPGYRVKVLDGNVLAGCERRLAETRGQRGAPLPGKSLVVLDPARGLITDLIPCEDAYTQERALLPAVIEIVQAGEVWIADRNFCTVAFFQALQARGAAGLIREHEQIRFTPLEAMRACGHIETGQVAEQTVRISATGTRPALTLRRIGLRLAQPTRQGEVDLYVWTTLPSSAADACTVARLYATRWRIETAFQKLTVELRCEINTLGYPRAALFGFATAVVAFNALAIVLAAINTAHDPDTIEQPVSSYYLGNEMAQMAESLDSLVDDQEWAPFRHLSSAQFALWLIDTARRLNLRRYRKHPRGPKKPSAKQVHDISKTHLSTARLLAERKKAKAP